MHSISTLASANARAADEPVHERTVGLLLEDADLAARLRERLETGEALLEVVPEEAAVIVTDLAETTAPGAAILRVGAGAEGRDAVAGADPDLIIAAVMLLAAGYHLEPHSVQPRRQGEPPHLSPRERQVATLLVDGASNKVIARTLVISVHTAKFHVTAILEKLGADNRADAVAMLLREGLVAI
ncbi:hypothetical protein GCM10011321_03010 [Youhaiella tibetensis]|uniref:Response regulator transcription factor n=1 Tax=Paradevosia tibetensis TaxID=1447062 RepID=A0A5B9DQZ3_9HYPH|nr:LuxR C-terminal-related transcriptional regulator [Youhaiella tibetensis]QEE21492.1 response regulator transcription factor [Youhaiella tibetensis]GGF14528.1 hypothetical protein GCM10011321_03010 [Youhaiella tibetensis]